MKFMLICGVKFQNKISIRAQDGDFSLFPDIGYPEKITDFPFIVV
jgi:hypothetical protein